MIIRPKLDVWHFKKLDIVVLLEPRVLVQLQGQLSEVATPFG